MYSRVLSFFVRNQLMTILLLLHDKAGFKQKEKGTNLLRSVPFLIDLCLYYCGLANSHWLLVE